jgi:PAS domain S-box-containing protein
MLDANIRKIMTGALSDHGDTMTGTPEDKGRRHPHGGNQSINRGFRRRVSGGRAPGPDPGRCTNREWQTGNRRPRARRNPKRRVLSSMTDKAYPAASVNRPATQPSLIWIGVAFGIVFYFIDVLIDVYVFQRGELVDQLLFPDLHDAWMRCSILLLTLAFASYASLLLRRTQTAAMRTQTAEKFLNSIIDNIPAMIFIKEAGELRFVRVNTVGERLLGLSTAQLIGKNDYDIFPKAQADFFTGKDREVLKSGTVLSIPEEEIDTRLQGKRVLHTRKVPVLDDTGRPAFLLGISDDITNIKQAKAALQETEIRLRTLFDAAAEFISLIDSDGIIQMVNRRVVEQSGYSAEELIGRNIKDFFTEESRHTCECNFPVLKERGQLRVDNDFVCRDGRIIQMECSATAIPDDAGAFSSFLIIQRDVTEKRAIVSALTDSERRFRAIFNSTFQFIGLLNPEGIVLEVNQTTLDFGGFTPNEIIGRPFWEMPWWTTTSEVQQCLKDALAQASGGKLVRHELAVHGKNDAVATIDFSLKPVLNEQGETVLIIPEGRDITDSKRAQEELQQHQQELAHVTRLSTLGEMASGIAHEINQPLTAISSYCESAIALLKLQPQLPPGLVEIVSRTTEQAHRAAAIIRQLRDFTTNCRDSMEVLDIDALVRKSIRLLEWELRDTHTMIELQLAAEERRILANKVQIEQVIVNLVRNSLEAIRETGKADGHISIQSTLLPNDLVQLSVTDNGTGVPADMVGCLFNAFQSGKPGGTGLGLSVSRSIIESHGGKLWFDKGHRNGAQFCFTLPLQGE